MARTEICNVFKWRLDQPELETDGFLELRLAEMCRAHRNGVVKIVTSANPNRNVVLSFGKDGGIIRWKLMEDRQEGILQGDGALTTPGTTSAGSWVTDVALTGGGDYAVSSSMDGTVSVWDLECGDGEPLMSSFCTGGSVSTVSLSDDNRVIATGSYDDMSLKIWSTQGLLAGCYKRGHAPWNHSNGIGCVKFEPNNYRRLYSCGGRTVTLWDANFGKVCVLGKSSDLVSSIAISRDARRVAYGGQSKDSGIGEIGTPLGGNGWRYHGEGGVRTELGPVNAMAFSPNGKFLAAATGVNIVIWRVEERLRVSDITCVTHFPNLQCTTIAWSPSGKYLLAGYSDGIINVIGIVDKC